MCESTYCTRYAAGVHFAWKYTIKYEFSSGMINVEWQYWWRISSCCRVETLSDVNVEKGKSERKKNSSSLLPCPGIYFRSHYQSLKAYLICFVWSPSMKFQEKSSHEASPHFNPLHTTWMALYYFYIAAQRACVVLWKAADVTRRPVLQSRFWQFCPVWYLNATYRRYVSD